MTIQMVRSPVSLAHIADLARESFGDMVKGVVDVHRRMLALGGELHSDEESVLLDDGSEQHDLWGINLYPEQWPDDDWVEFDSMINVRPAANNRSRGVEDENTRKMIRDVVSELVIK